MAELFSNEWMTKYQEVWNSEPELSGELGKIGFNSTIGYGYDGDSDPVALVKAMLAEIIETRKKDGASKRPDMSEEAVKRFRAG